MLYVESGDITQVVDFVAVDSTDLKTRETGLTTWTVYRARGTGAAAVMTTPTVTERDATNMPGVYRLLLDEDMTITAGKAFEVMTYHITHAGMSPVTISTALYAIPGVIRRNTAQAGAAGSITLDASASATDDFYAGCLVELVDGTGVGQARGVTAYSGTTKVATVDRNWATNPASNSVFRLYAGSLGPTVDEIGDDVAARSLTVGSIGSNVITAASINAGAITAAKFAAGAIDAAAVANGAIDAATFAAGAIDATAIANGAIDAATFAAGAIDAAAIANGAIDAATFAAGAIDATAIATGAIDADALAADAANEIRDAIFARAFSAAYGSHTFDELCKMVASVLLGKASGLATSTAIYRNLADTADVVTATVDADGNRSAVTRAP